MLQLPKTTNTVFWRRALSVLFVLLIVFLVFSSHAVADEDDYSQYEPSGIGEFFPSPDIDPGLEKTLYEKYSVMSWYWDFKDSSWWNLKENTIDPALNGLANALFMVNQFLVRGAIQLTWAAQDNSVNGAIGEKVSPVVGSVASEFGGWLLPTALAVGALMAMVAFTSSSAEGQKSIIGLFLCALVATSIVVGPDVWVEGSTALQAVGQNSVAKVAGAATAELKVPIEGPEATFGDNASDNSMRIMADSIWRTYVVTPWCIGEFGTIEACSKWGEELLSRSITERVPYINDTIKDEIGGSDSAAYKQLSGRDGVQRLVIAIIAFITSAVFALIIICLGAALNLFSMMVFLMLIVGPFFLCLSPIPFFRTWAKNWAKTLFSFIVFTFISYLLLLGALTITGVTMSLAGEYGWLMAAFESIIAIIAAVLLFIHLKKITSNENIGFAAAASKALGVAYIGKRLTSGFKGKGTKTRASSATSNSGKSGVDRWDKNAPKNRGGGSKNPNTPRPNNTPPNGPKNNNNPTSPGNGGKKASENLGNDLHAPDKRREYSGAGKRNTSGRGGLVMPKRADIHHSNRDQAGVEKSKNHESPTRKNPATNVASLERKNTPRLQSGPPRNLTIKKDDRPYKQVVKP